MNSSKLCVGNLRRIKMCTIYLEECTEEAMFVKAVSFQFTMNENEPQQSKLQVNGRLPIP